MEKFAISRLIGAPPGYVGYEEGGQLTEKVRRKPYAVVLLDEIEKAHPDVFNMLLQILDDGFITDSLGRRVDFRNTIIIMTSNIGARQVKDFGLGVGFGTAAIKAQANDHTKSVIQNALKKTFAPEFLNRIDDVVIFNSLQKEHIAEVIKIELQELEGRIHELGFSLSLSKKAISFLNEKALMLNLALVHSVEPFRSISKMFSQRKSSIEKFQKVQSFNLIGMEKVKI